MTETANDRIVLFFTPGTCSRVSLNALEELQIPFEGRPVDIFTGAQRRPEYLAINPKGKVPTLLIGDAVLTETPAILLWLAEAYPGAKLIPGDDVLARAQAFAGIAWCSNTVHPLVRTVLMPQRMTTGDPDPVRAAALAQLTAELDLMQQRLTEAAWWCGDDWSIVDVYLAWITGMCLAAKVDMNAYGGLLAHMGRVRERPSFQRSLVREQHALDTAGIVLPGGRL